MDGTVDRKWLENRDEIISFLDCIKSYPFDLNRIGGQLHFMYSYLFSEVKSAFYK